MNPEKGYLLPSGAFIVADFRINLIIKTASIRCLSMCGANKLRHLSSLSRQDAV